MPLPTVGATPLSCAFSLLLSRELLVTGAAGGRRVLYALVAGVVGSRELLAADRFVCSSRRSCWLAGVLAADRFVCSSGRSCWLAGVAGRRQLRLLLSQVLLARGSCWRRRHGLAGAGMRARSAASAGMRAQRRPRSDQQLPRLEQTVTQEGCTSSVLHEITGAGAPRAGSCSRRGRGHLPRRGRGHLPRRGCGRLSRRGLRRASATSW
jgi:hypothetical protein